MDFRGVSAAVATVRLGYTTLFRLRQTLFRQTLCQVLDDGNNCQLTTSDVTLYQERRATETDGRAALDSIS